jgi:hypothetical protein
MGKEGIDILNDVVYITMIIMGSMTGKSRKYYARRARRSGRKGERAGSVTRPECHEKAVARGFPDRNSDNGHRKSRLFPMGNCNELFKMLYNSGLYILKGCLGASHAFFYRDGPDASFLFTA